LPLLVRLCALSGTTLPASDLDDAVAKILSRPVLSGSTVSVLVRRVGSGEVIYSHAPNRLLPPASTSKLLSSAGALAILGKNYRFRTPVVATGPIENGRLKGDLVLVASGDPNLSQRVNPKGRLRFRDTDHSYAGFSGDASTVPGDPLVVLKSLARKVAKAGVTNVLGDVIVDDGLFAERNDSFVGNFSALCVNDNLIDVRIAPGDRIGDLVRIAVLPRSDAIQVRVLARTVTAGNPLKLWIESKPGAANFEVHGTMPITASPRLRVGSIRDPAQTGASILKELLEAEGIEIDGRARTARFGPKVYARQRKLAEHVSAPLSEALRVILKVSQNVHSTMLPVIVGALKGERADRVGGFERMRDYFNRVSLDTKNIVVQSGSGGGHVDRLSSRFLVDLLTHLASRTDFHVIWDALPISGVDGTLSSRLRTPSLRTRVRAKTGTLLYRGAFSDRWVYVSKALAGYIDLTGRGRRQDLAVFSITIANTLVESQRRGADQLFRIQEDILQAVVDAERAARIERAVERSSLPGSKPARPDTKPAGVAPTGRSRS
ncbi:MAG: D-alanyl-D-alanine carboxypeptidase/D-alanyl-D-alanine-endopeptidase, partial [Planctomycetota bacterium]